MSRTLCCWEPEIAVIKSCLILVYILLFFAPSYIIYITRTRFSRQIQWYHSLDVPKTSWEDIRVFSPEPCHQSGHFRSIEPVLHPKPTTPYIDYTARTGFLSPFSWCPPFCDKVLRGSVYWHLAVAVQSMCTILQSYTTIF